jgi:hypothetical protein
MSEYWKSTPKYWCKFCKDYVRDTKTDKAKHDATPRHQGNIQRSLRNIHREKEQEERQTQRAKEEVARLNGIVGGKSTSAAGPATAANTGKRDAPKDASVEDRKRQMKQLADMGVAVPEEYRREVAMAGNWQTVKATPVEEPSVGVLGPGSIAYGVRKRKIEEDEAEEAAEAAAAIKQKQWGSRFKMYPGKRGRLDDGSDDVEALLGGITTKDEPRYEPKDEEVKQEQEDGPTTALEEKLDVSIPVIKKEESLEEGVTTTTPEAPPPDLPVKTEETAEPESKPPGAGIVFKKRRPKVTQRT